MTALLALDAVRKSYRRELWGPKHLAVDGLSLAVGEGRCIGLLGANGAGKTTTIRLILGLIRPDSGLITFNGKPLNTAMRRGIGYMPEVNKLPGALTADEILRYQLRIATGQAEAARIAAKLTEIGLGDKRYARLKELSKGLARRVAWAQATIHAPRLLILDEPSSGLDPLGQRDLSLWIEAEKRRGTTILLCSHELSQVRALCDDLLILSRGRTVLSTATAAASPAWFWPWAYSIHVEAVDTGSLDTLRAAQQLPPWQGVRAEGRLLALGFARDDAAQSWLKALLAHGAVIAKFNGLRDTFDDPLIAYYEGTSP